MSADVKKGGKTPNAQPLRVQRNSNIYDRIAAARAKRNTVGAERPKPKRDQNLAGADKPHEPASALAVRANEARKKFDAGLVAANSPEFPAATTRETTRTAAPVVAESQDTGTEQSRSKRRASLLLWTASAAIAALLIAYVAINARIEANAVASAPALQNEIAAARTAPASASQPVWPPLSDLTIPSLTLPQAPLQAPNRLEAPVLDALPGPEATDTQITATATNIDTSRFRVVLNAPPNLPPASLGTTQDALGTVGFNVEPRRVNLSISKSNVRYFHSEDAEMANVLAASINAELRDFTEFRPSPKQGLIEVWMSGRSTGRASTRAQPFSELGAELRRLQQRIERALGG